MLLSAIAVLSLSPASWRPVTTLGHTREHILIHLLVGLTFGIGYARRLGAMFVVALGLVGFTAAIELAQLFVPGRHARLRDFVIDTGAVWLGLVVAWMCNITAARLVGDKI